MYTKLIIIVLLFVFEANAVQKVDKLPGKAGNSSDLSDLEILMYDIMNSYDYYAYNDREDEIYYDYTNITQEMFELLLPNESARIIDNGPENRKNSSLIDLLVSKNYTGSALSLYANESRACPNLTRPDCEVKVTKNTMMQDCEVCVIRENESCDPMLDGCESGTICLPHMQDDYDVNVCKKFSSEDWNRV